MYSSAQDLLDYWIFLSQISGCIHTHCYLQGGWKIKPDFHKDNRGIFHLLRQGECQIISQNHSYQLSAGSFLFFPRGMSHCVHSVNKNNTVSYSIQTEKHDFFHVKRTNSPIVETELFCGYFDYAPNSFLINELPDVIQVSVGKGQLDQLSQLIYSEMNSKLPAQKMAIDSLSNFLFIMVLRKVLNQNERLGHLLSIKDEKMIRLVNAIIKNPSKNWTLESMSSYCLLSRSVFAKRFRESVGYTPNHFLVKIRINIAMLLMKTTSKSLLDIALSSGFQSESYFSKAFKAHTELTPNQYRHS